MLQALFCLSCSGLSSLCSHIGLISSSVRAVILLVPAVHALASPCHLHAHELYDSFNRASNVTLIKLKACKSYCLAVTSVPTRSFSSAAVLVFLYRFPVLWDQQACHLRRIVCLPAFICEPEQLLS